MLYKCVHVKFGTVLYRKGIDTSVSLSRALNVIPLSEANKVYDKKTVKNTPEDKTVLHEAGE